MPNNSKSTWLLRCSHLSILKLVAFAFLYLSGTALAVDTQCKPDNILVSGFENELPLLFEDTFEGCRSSLWRELSGNWLVTDGAYFTTLDSPANLLPLEPNNFIIEAEMSDINGGGLWMRLADGNGAVLQIGSASGVDYLYWQVSEAGVLGPELNPSANGAITPGTGKHIIKVVVEGSTYDAFVDGKLVSTLTHADIITAGRTPPTRGMVGLQGYGTSTRFDRLRIWGKNKSTLQIEFTTDQSVLLEEIGQSYQFGAHVIDSLGVDVPGIDIDWSIEPSALVSMTASDASSATVQADALGVDAVTLKASVPSLQISNDAQILLADLAPDANYLDSNVVVDNGYISGQVVLVRDAETELIQVGDVLISGDEAGLLVRVLTVNLTPTQVILTVEPAKITDAFENLDIDGSSAIQSMAVHFDAVTNFVSVKSSFKSGKVTTQGFSIDGLTCKTEDQSNFGLVLTGGSIDWEIDNELNASLKITNSIVQEFSLSAIQSLVLTAATGSLKFSSVLAGTVTCDLPLPKIESPTIPISVFSFGMGIQPKVGVKVSGSISGPSFTIEGPKGKLTDSATEGIKYTAGGGWEPMAGFSRMVGTDPFSAMFDASVQFELDASAYGGIGFEFIANLGKGILSYELAAVEFADVNSDVTLNAQFASPFDPMVKEYTGPKWDLKGNAKGEFKAELTSGGLVTLLKALDVPTTLPFTGDIFDPIEVPILNSPNPGSVSVACIPANCNLDPVGSDHANITVSTDDVRSGQVQYLGSLDGKSDLLELVSSELFNSSSLGVWDPSQSDENGTYRAYVRIKTDALSNEFPYTFDNGSSQDIVVGPTFALEVQKLDNATQNVTISGVVISQPEGIDCGETCEAHFAVGAEVTLTAVSSKSTTFVKWADDSGVCPGSTNPDCVVSMDANKIAKAVYDINCLSSETVLPSGTWLVTCYSPDDDRLWLESLRITEGDFTRPLGMNVYPPGDPAAPSTQAQWQIPVSVDPRNNPSIVITSTPILLSRNNWEYYPDGTVAKTENFSSSTRNGIITILSWHLIEYADGNSYTDTWKTCDFPNGNFFQGTYVYVNGIKIGDTVTLLDPGACPTGNDINSLGPEDSVILQCITMGKTLGNCPLAPFVYYFPE